MKGTNSTKVSKGKSPILELNNEYKKELFLPINEKEKEIV